MTAGEGDGLRWVELASGVLRGDPTNPRDNQKAIPAWSWSLGTPA